MKRWLIGIAAALSLLPLACTAQPASKLQEGKDYQTVREAIAPADPKKVTVEEFFWYGCPHCFHADPYVESWRTKKPAYIDFKRIPNTLGRPEGKVHSLAFYVADTLGVLDKTHPALFAAIHEKRLPMSDIGQIRAFYEKIAGIKPDAFDRATSSFPVDTGMRRAEQLARSYGITSVPVFVVGGKYFTNATMAGGNEKLMPLVEALADKVRRERR